MKRLTLCISVLTCFAMMSHAQSRDMHIALQDGSTVVIPTDSIASIDFKPATAASLEGLTGRWRLIASANGVSNGGIYTAITDTIIFTATPSADGTALLCHTDRLYSRSGTTYPADWRMLVEQDAQSGKRRVGWALSAEQPVSDKEFNESADKYLEDGFFYFGNGTEAHHYIYLLSENIETQRLEGMTLWSGWATDAQTTYTFPQNQQVYGVVATAIPYQPGTAVGYFEIWASPRFERLD